MPLPLRFGSTNMTVYVCLADSFQSEHDRLDMLQHCLSGILLDQRNPKAAYSRDGQEVQDLFMADVIAPCQMPGRLLDIGCGTGIWALDIAERSPGSIIEGIDLVGAQPDPSPNIIWRTSKAGHRPAVDFDKPYWSEIYQN